MSHRLRCFIVGLTVAAPLLLSACSDSPTEVSQPRLEPVRVEASVALGCVPAPTAASLLTMINGLLPRSPLRTSLIALVNALPPRLQDRIKTAVRQLIFPIQDLVFRAFYAGRLSGGTSSATFDKVLRFSEALHCYVGLTPPTYPTATSGADVVVAVVFPNSPPTTVVVPSEHAAVTVPTGAAPTGGVTIVVRKLPDGPPGPLFTTLDQYPFFYEFTGTTVTGPVTFNLDVLAGICPRDNLAVIDANLRLAHNVGPFFGDAEVLPRPAGAVPGLDCTDLALGSAPNTGSGLGDFAWGGWRWMNRTLAPLGGALLPQPLHAATLALATTGVGGTTKKFSPFGIVDISSNPANLGFNPVAGPFGSLAAVPGGSVTAPSVVLTSQKGDRIPNWPVTFSVASGAGTINGGTVPVTVVSGPDGLASLTSWSLGAAGINTVTATPAPVAQNPAEPASSDPYRPAGRFAPTSLTFAATAAGEIDYLTAGYRYLISNTDRVFPVGVVNFDDPGYQDTGWLTGNAAFGFNDPANNCPLVSAGGGVKVLWPGGTDILLRRPFTVPAGTTSAEVRVAVDNDIRVFVNGTEITTTGGEPDEDGFVRHDGCPTTDSFTFTASGLVDAGVNWLAIQARDRGGSTYLDADVVPVLPSEP